MTEIGRLVKDFLDPHSYIQKFGVNMKNLIYQIYGEAAFEIEFYRQLRHYQTHIMADRHKVQRMVGIQELFE